MRGLALLAALLNVAACDDFRSGPTEIVDPLPATPNLITRRSDQLACAKALLAAGDAMLRPAFDRLVAAADSALAVAPASVTDKKRVPPSGDRHDYMSIARYWWPDPTQPDGLPYIRRDGERNPEADEDYDRPRLHSMMNVVNTLALAYYFTGNEAYARHAASHLRTWFLYPATRMNPHLKYAQAIPGRNTGRGTGIIDTHILPRRLLDGLAFLRASPHWTILDQQGMHDWMTAFLDWLWTSQRGQEEFAQRNNHGSWYDVQIAGLALFLGQSELAREIVASSATRRVAVQIDADGSQPSELRRSRSHHYSVFNLSALMRLAEFGRTVDVDLWHYEAPNGASIRAALDFVAPYADPSRPWPREQIEPLAPEAMLEPLRMGEIEYGDPEYSERIAEIPEHVTRDHRARLSWARPSTTTSRDRFPQCS